MGLSKEKRRLIERLKHPRRRGNESAFLVEGVRSAGEFLRTPDSSGIRFALVSPRLRELGEGEEILAELSTLGIQAEEVDDEELRQLSDTERPQGVLLVVKEPEHPWPPAGKEDLRVLLLDGIQDPGNVGTLIRTARGFGLDAVVALEGTADPWGAKAVRSGAGASAHIAVLREPWEKTRDWIRSHDLALLVADAGGTDLRATSLPGRWALVMGNEGAGVRREILEEARERLAIPMAGGVDSLNVASAGAVLLFSLTSSPPCEGETG